MALAAYFPFDLMVSHRDHLNHQAHRLAPLLDSDKPTLRSRAGPSHRGFP